MGCSEPVPSLGLHSTAPLLAFHTLGNWSSARLTNFSRTHSMACPCTNIWHSQEDENFEIPGIWDLAIL